MLRCFEQAVCNISYLHQNQKVKFNDWSMNIDTPKRISADFESLNVSVESDNEYFVEKLFVNKPVAKGSSTTKKTWLW